MGGRVRASVHVHLAPGERLRPGAREAVERAFAADPRLGAVLLPLVPEGVGYLPRVARRYVASWDARLLHAQNWFVPFGRVASRVPLPGPLAADAAPHLADLVLGGAKVDTLPDTWVDTGLARDLEAWTAWWEVEGRAWGRLAARDARFPRFLPATSWPGWWRHNVLQSGRRLVECLQARKAPDLAAWLLLHATREAAWTGGCVRGLRGA